MVVNIIGAGLAGCECAYILARNNIKVKLYEMKPNKKSAAHTSDDFAELVCSNSLKSNAITNACGLLKEEMKDPRVTVLSLAPMLAKIIEHIEFGKPLTVVYDMFM